MEISASKLIQILKCSTTQKKEEIFQLDSFINNFQSEQKFNSQIYLDLFQILIEVKLSSHISTGNTDYLYLLKILQSIRLLTRNNSIRGKLSSESIIKTFEQTLKHLIAVKSVNITQSEIIDSCFIEIISIVRRYFSHNAESFNKDNIEVIETLINDTNIVDHLIFLLNRDNIIVLKLLHSLLISIIEEYILILILIAIESSKSLCRHIL